jgi:hypothetical protein
VAPTHTAFGDRLSWPGGAAGAVPRPFPGGASDGLPPGCCPGGTVAVLLGPGSGGTVPAAVAVACGLPGTRLTALLGAALPEVGRTVSSGLSGELDGRPGVGLGEGWRDGGAPVDVGVSDGAGDRDS